MWWCRFSVAVGQFNARTTKAQLRPPSFASGWMAHSSFFVFGSCHLRFNLAIFIPQPRASICVYGEAAPSVLNKISSRRAALLWRNFIFVKAAHSRQCKTRIIETMKMKYEFLLCLIISFYNRIICASIFIHLLVRNLFGQGMKIM